jgi:hypothetical protein
MPNSSSPRTIKIGPSRRAKVPCKKLDTDTIDISDHTDAAPSSRYARLRPLV